MRKIRIAFFINNLGQGGAEKQLYMLIRDLDSTVFEKHVYLFAYQEDAFYKEIFSLLDTVVFRNPLKQKILVLKIIEAGCFIRKKLNDNPYDLVFTTLFMNNTLVRLFGPARYKNKFIANIRTSFNSYSRRRILAEKLQIKKSYVVFNSRKTLMAFAEYMPKKFHSKLSFIHNGFDLPVETISYVYSEQNNITLGCLGRLNTEKNIIQVVRVFQKIENTSAINRLIIQGHKGNQYDQIMKEMKSGKIDIIEKQQDIEPFFNSIRILVIPSHFEGCPNVLFEGLLRKKLCIISQGANSDDFIEEGKNGFVYNGTDEGLIIALQKAVSIVNTEKETEIIRNGFTYASDNFSTPAMIQKYKALFLDIYAKNKGCC